MKRKATTLNAYVPVYLKAAKTTLKPKTFAEYKRLLDRVVCLDLGDLPLSSLTTRRIEQWHAAVAERTPTTANRALAVLSALLRHAARWGQVPVNPAHGVQWAKERGRNRYLSPAEKDRLLAAIETLPALECEFIRTMLFTGARPGELLAATWESVTGREIVLEDSKNGDRRVIYLPEGLLERLQGLPTAFGLIFAGVNPTVVWRKVRVQAGLPDVRLYDLRHAFASTALGAGLSLEVIGQLLGHRRTQSTKRYAHLMRDTGRDAVTRVEAALGGL